MDSLLAQNSFVIDTGITTEVGSGNGTISSFPPAHDNYPTHNLMTTLFECEVSGFIAVVNFPSIRISGNIGWASSGKSASFSAKWGVENGDIQYGSDEIMLFSGSPSDSPSVSVIIPATSITITPSVPKLIVGLICSANGNGRDYASVANFSINPVAVEIEYKTLKLT